MKFFVFCVIFLEITTLYGQKNAPDRIALQSIIRNNDGVLQTNTNIGVRLSLIKDNQFGQSIYVETHTLKTNSNGLLTLYFGDGNPVLGALKNVNWNNGPYVLKTEFDVSGGTNYSIIGYTDVVSVPYSLSSNYSDTAEFSKFTKSVNCIGCIQLENLNKSALESIWKDTSSTNEIQFLSISKDTISLSNGGFVKLPKDLDRDSSNEIQKLVKIQDTLYLSKSNFILLADENPTNELQILSRSKDTIYLSNGGFVKLMDNDSLNEIQNFRVSHDTLRLTKSKNYVLLGNKDQDTINNVVAQLGDAVYAGSYNFNSSTTFPNLQSWINLSCNIDLGANTYILGIQGSTPFGILNFNNSTGNISLLRNINSNLKKQQLGIDQFSVSDRKDTTFTWFSSGIFTIYKPKNDTYINLPNGLNNTSFFNKLTISTTPNSSQNQLMAFSKRGDTMLMVFQKGDPNDFYYYYYQYIISTDKLSPIDSIELTLRNGTKCTTANVVLNSIYGALISGDFKPSGLSTKFQLSAGVFKNFKLKQTKLLNIPPYPIANAFFTTDKNFIFWNNGVVYLINVNNGLMRNLGDSKPINFYAQNSIFLSISTAKNIGNLIKSNGKYYLLGYFLNPGTGNETGYLYSVKVE